MAFQKGCYPKEWSHKGVSLARDGLLIGVIARDGLKGVFLRDSPITNGFKENISQQILSERVVSLEGCSVKRETCTTVVNACT